MNDSRIRVSAVEQLCPACGLCCNGVIFADVKLQAGDKPNRLKQLGFTLNSRSLGSGLAGAREKTPRFYQPCAAFNNGRCKVYIERPRYCREFECLLLKNVLAGRLTTEKASQVIGKAKAGVESVLRLLRLLKDSNESLPLATRFRQTSARLETHNLDKETAEIYGQLTLEMHDLNLLLSESFYPAA